MKVQIYFLSHISHIQVVSNHMRVVATTLETPDTERFPQCRVLVNYAALG